MKPTHRSSWPRIATLALAAILPTAAPSLAGTIGEKSIDVLPSRHAAVVRFHAGPAELSQRFAEVIPAVQKFLLDEGLVPGLVFSRTLWAEDDWLVVEAGMEVGSPGNINGETPAGPIHFIELAAGSAAAVDHYGPYLEVGAAHEALAGWWDERGMQLIAPPLEYYVTDPGSEPDPTRWLTRVQHPIAPSTDLGRHLELVVGRWVGPPTSEQGAANDQAAGPFFEEQWSPFVDSEAIGTFRLRAGGQARFYEFMTIDVSGVEQQGMRRPELSIKHFSPGLVGWEQPEEAVRFALLELGTGVVRWARREDDRFAELTYTRRGEALTVELKKSGGSKPDSVSTFPFQRVSP